MERKKTGNGDADFFFRGGFSSGFGLGREASVANGYFPSSYFFCRGNSHQTHQTDPREERNEVIQMRRLSPSLSLPHSPYFPEVRDSPISTFCSSKSIKACNFPQTHPAAFLHLSYARIPPPLSPHKFPSPFLHLQLFKEGGRGNGNGGKGLLPSFFFFFGV